MKLLATAATAIFAVLTLGQAFAASPEDTIRQTLNERIPQLTKIDEVRTTPMQGLYEVRVGTDVFYTDAQGNYLIQGELIDTQARRNLTEDRIKALTAVKFSDLCGPFFRMLFAVFLCGGELGFVQQRQVIILDVDQLELRVSAPF